MPQEASAPVPGDPTEGSKHDAAGMGARVARNSTGLAAGEVVGKLATLALVAVLAREAGASALGVWIYALALCQITTMPMDLGLDRWLLRRIAADGDEYRARFPVVLGIKASLVAPCALLTLGAVAVLGSSADTSRAVMIVFVGLVLDALTRTIDYVFSGVERGYLTAFGTISQRTMAACLGIAAVLAGKGVTGVALAYVTGSVLGLTISIRLLHRHVGRPPWRPSLAGWRPVTSASVPFAAQDVLTVLLFRVDAVILAGIAGAAAVGEYGAAYRLLEATMFVAIALAGAFSAMFTYLGTHSSPSVQAVFSRAVKLGVALLAPVAVVLGLLATEIITLLFGEGLSGAASSLRILAPVVVLLGAVTLTSSLVVSRESPRRIVGVTAVATGLNIALNLALIPSLGAVGAAIAMLVAELVFLGLVLRLAGRLVGPVDWLRTLAAPTAAVLTMVGAIAALPVEWPVAAGASLLVYGLVFLAVDRRVAPDDLRFVSDVLRRRAAPA